MQTQSDRSAIRVVLIGNDNQKQQFVKSVLPSLLPRTNVVITFCCPNSSKNYVVYPNFEINTIHYDNLKKHQQDYLKKLYSIDAIIYLSPLPNQKKFWEEIRDQNKCIAIDFKGLKCTPWDSIYAVEKLSELNKRSTTRFFRHNTYKSLLLWSSKQDEQSIFATLPQELLNIISAMMHELAGRDINKSIVQKLPEENRKSNCLIQ